MLFLGTSKSQSVFSKWHLYRAIIIVSVFAAAATNFSATNFYAPLLAATTSSYDATSKKKKPHIVMVVMDDLGSHDLGLHGTGIKTPHSDKLAQDGMYLDNYYVTPYCSPTRASLMSGKYPIHTGIYNVISDYSAAGLPVEEETLADLLKKGGYETRAVGKWHLGFAKWEFTPTYRGFDSFYGFYKGGQDYFTHMSHKAYDLRFDSQPNCGDGCSQIIDERGNYSTHVYTREAIHVIQNYNVSSYESDDGKPLFLYLAFQAVHGPNEVPPEYMEVYDDKNWTEQRKIYAGMLTAADEGIGNVTQALKDNGLWDDTLFIFTTDNGGPTVACAVQGSSNYPKRGGKCSVWEGGTTGDAFMSGPVLERLGIRQQSKFPHLFHVVDWLPTLAELVGVATRQDIDGKSQLRGLRYDMAVREHVLVGYAYGQKYGTKGWYGPAIRYGRWKLIQGKSGGPDQYDIKPRGSRKPLPAGVNDSSYVLYDLETDIGEVNNVASLHPDVVEFLRQKLKEYHEEVVPPQPDEDPSCPWTGTVKTTVGPTW